MSELSLAARPHHHVYPAPADMAPVTPSWDNTPDKIRFAAGGNAMACIDRVFLFHSDPHPYYGYYYGAVLPTEFTILTLPPEGAALHAAWQGTPSSEDSTISGVFADWLQENEEDLLTGRDVAARRRFRSLLRYLRSRLAQPLRPARRRVQRAAA